MFLPPDYRDIRKESRSHRAEIISMILMCSDAPDTPHIPLPNVVLQHSSEICCGITHACDFWKCITSILSSHSCTNDCTPTLTVFIISSQLDAPMRWYSRSATEQLWPPNPSNLQRSRWKLSKWVFLHIPSCCVLFFWKLKWFVFHLMMAFNVVASTPIPGVFRCT